MKANEILEQIYRVREEHARECGYNIDVMFARMREDLKVWEAEGWKIVSLDPRKPTETSSALHEEPPKKSGHEHLQGGQ